MRQVVAYRWDEVEVRPQQRAVIRSGRVMRASQTLVALLGYLIEHRNRTVTHAELAQVGWHGRPVGSAALARAVARCRALVDEDHAAASVIQASWGQGYRFCADAEVVRAGTAAPAAHRREGRATPDVPWLALLTGSGDADPRADADDLTPDISARHRQLAESLASWPGIRLLPDATLRSVLASADASDGPGRRRAIWWHTRCRFTVEVEWRHTARGWHALATVHGREGCAVVQAHARAPRWQAAQARLVEALRLEMAALGPRRPPHDLPDGFSVEAWWRAAAAMEQGRWALSQRLARALLDQVGPCLSAELLLLRVLSHTEPAAAVAMGTALLARIATVAAPEHVVQVHTALGRATDRQGGPGARERACAHLREAIALSEGHAPATWAVEAALAGAAFMQQGQERDRDQARSLLTRAAAQAAETDEPFLAAMARSQLARLAAGDGDVLQAERLHADLLHIGLRHRWPIRSAEALAFQASLVHAQGRLAEADTAVTHAWSLLATLAPDERAQVAAQVAQVDSQLQLDRGDTVRLVRGIERPASPGAAGSRCAIQAATAEARLAYVEGDWPAALARLREAADCALRRQACRLATVPLGSALELAAAQNDRAAVHELLMLWRSATGVRGSLILDAATARATAWLQLSEGDTTGATRTLLSVAMSAHQARVLQLARVDAIWLLARRGAGTLAAELLDTLGPWGRETAQGLLARAAWSVGRNRHAEARAALAQARSAWRGAWPQDWSEPGGLLHGPGSASMLPGQVLLARLHGACSPGADRHDRVRVA